MAVHDFWADDRSTAPPLVTMISTENRKVSVGLSPVVISGETIQSATLVATVVRDRNGVAVSPSPIVLPLAYDAGSKIVAAKINASLLPRDEPCNLIFSFDVTGPLGTEQRSAYVALWVSV